MAIGWIKLNRKILEWEWYDDLPVRATFIHLLLTANYKDKKWKGRTVKRGQVLVGSINTPKEIGISRAQFRRSIKCLKSTNEITIKPTNKNTLVTIEKYDDYQDLENETTNKTTIDTTNKKPTKNQQKTTTKEDKNIKKLRSKEVIDDVVGSDNVFFKIEKCKEKYLANKKMIKAVCLNPDNNISENEIEERLTDFNQMLLETGQHLKEFDDYCSHFRSWHKKNKKTKLKFSTNR